MFIQTHDKIKYNEKFHFKNGETQIIFQSKKFFDNPESSSLKKEVEFGDEFFKHKATLIFSTKDPELVLVKMAPRGSKVAGTETGRGHKSKKACKHCAQ